MDKFKIEKKEKLQYNKKNKKINENFSSEM